MPTDRAAGSEAPRTEFLGLCFDNLDTRGAVAWIKQRTAESPLAYVITPNVDHMVRLPRLGRVLRRVYRQADLCLCDSRVLAKLARMTGVELHVAPGSDLTKAVLEEAVEPGDTVCLIGGAPTYGVRLAEIYPHLRIVQHIAPMGLLHNPAARAAAITAAEKAHARIILIAVGAPQQELIAAEMRRSGRTRGTALCIGASVSFIAGDEKRAPLVVQEAGMEWAWRLTRNPRRLGKRYLVDGPAIFPLVWRWAQKHKHKSA